MPQIKHIFQCDIKRSFSTQYVCSNVASILCPISSVCNAIPSVSFNAALPYIQRIFQRDIQCMFQHSAFLYPAYVPTRYPAYLPTQHSFISSVSFNVISHYIYMNDKYQALQALLNQSWPLTVQILAAKYHGFTPSMYPALSTHSLVSSHQVHGLFNLLLSPVDS